MWAFEYSGGTGDALLSWVEGVIEGNVESILFIRPSSSATSGVVFYGCEGSVGPVLKILSPYEQD